MSKTPSENLPLAQVMVHRPTGRVVGPLSPIAPEDWPFIVIEPNETLWRYMDFWKFEDMLKTDSLYFARPDQFADPFEGLHTTGNAAGKSKSNQLFHSLYKIAEPSSENDVKVNRDVVFINCWHRSVTLVFASVSAYAFRSLGRAEAKTYYGMPQNTSPV